MWGENEFLVYGWICLYCFVYNQVTYFRLPLFTLKIKITYNYTFRKLAKILDAEINYWVKNNLSLDLDK